MATRFGEEKPDSALQKNVARARQRARNERRAKAAVVGASLAVTMLSWTFFSQGDATVQPTTQVADAPPTATVAAVVQAPAPSPTSAISTLQVSSISKVVTQQAAPAPIALSATQLTGNAVSVPEAVAVTRSSNADTEADDSSSDNN